ncbi:MAG: Lysine exporter protein [Candidatus Solibacter sp.]|jgi:threonine/homoserine/homoserine lactone efflux protein|nr:Lysine exporter protein [Candidatus Solibacter sp.]
MIALMLIIKGLVAGLAIAVPVGPINVLVASRTLTKGRVSGLLSGLGAASADALYGALAGFSISLVIDFLMREEFWIRVIGGILLVGIGIVYYRKPPQSLQKKSEDSPAHSDYVSTLLLTLTNPTTVLSFMAVLTALGMGGHRPWWLTFLLVGGILCGSMLWWVVLVTLVNWLRDRFNEESMRWMNRIAGIAIGGFGLFTFAMGLAHRH